MNKLEEGEAGPLKVHVGTALMVVVTLMRTSCLMRVFFLTQQWSTPGSSVRGVFSSRFWIFIKWTLSDSWFWIIVSN